MKEIAALLLAAGMVFQVSAQSAYKTVNGRIYSILDENAWTVFNDGVQVIGYSDDALICQSYTTEKHDAGGYVTSHANPRYIPNTVTTRILGSMFVLKNYMGRRNVPVGGDIGTPIKAIRCGTEAIYSTGGGWTTTPPTRPPSSSRLYIQHPYYVDVYDMGVDYYPPARPLTDEENMAALKKRAEHESKVVQWLLNQATNGSPSAEYSLGVRYLKGQGVPKDETLGRQWLQKASADGSVEAAATLATLTAAQTNSGAASSISSTNSAP